VRLFFEIIYLFIYLWDWGLNSGLHSCKIGTLSLEPCLESTLLWLCFGDEVFWTICLEWSWRTQSPKQLGLQSHWCLRSFLFVCIYLHIFYLFIYLFIYLAVLGIEPRASHMTAMCSVTWTIPLSRFFNVNIYKLWIFPIALLSLCPISFNMVSFYFHLFLHNF
jgi:hypothetical protein